jgi:pimeloyl-ACP methyl ester carboxylesterase
VVPLLPGFPGGDRGHSVLDIHLDWLLATRRLLDAAGLDGADLAGSSVGASLAAEMAAVWPRSVDRLALIAPFGLFDEEEPPQDPWAQKPDVLAGMLCAEPETWKALKAAPEGANAVEWPVEQTRAAEAAARIFWPLGDTRLSKRLPLIKSPTLLLWGEQDRLIPPSYARRFAERLGGPNETRFIPGAAHLAELDQPDEVARAVLDWTN